MRRLVISPKAVQVLNLSKRDKDCLSVTPPKEVNFVHSPESTGCVPLERCTARISFSQIRM